MCHPSLSASFHFFGRDMQLYSVGDGIDGNRIAVLHESDGAARLGFWYDVSNAEAMRAGTPRVIRSAAVECEINE